ncbi:MAG: heat-inducible transcription repressor HrcA [Dehalococcoidia bacterium]|nr:heat-inducible transcription repressor HrcA [Dehalococcoidia bacterium]
MITEREVDILNIIVGEYVSTVQPVGSKQIASHLLKEVSSATIRNDMADLEEEGYIVRPHISAGGVPSNNGYRRHVASLDQTAKEPPASDRELILKKLRPSVRDIEKFVKTAGQCLADLVQNVVVITYPVSEKQRLVHFDLVKVNSTDALLVLVLPERRIKTVTVKFHSTISQDQMTFVASRLNGLFSGKNQFQIRFQHVSLSPTETSIIDALLSIMNGEEATRFDLHVAGVKYLLAQPEFTGQTASGVVGALEDSIGIALVLAGALKSGSQVLIGDDLHSDPLRPCSLVTARYGVADEVTGMIGIIGPTRMQYGRSIALIRSVSLVMNDLLAEQYGGRV